jgi:endonuclease III
MKILRNIELDEWVKKEESCETSKIKDSVFDGVKELFYLTYNKDATIQELKLKKKTIDRKIQKTSLYNKKLNQMKATAENDLKSSGEKLNEAINLLTKSLEGDKQ